MVIRRHTTGTVDISSALTATRVKEMCSAAGIAIRGQSTVQLREALARHQLAPADAPTTANTTTFYIKGKAIQQATSFCYLGR